MFDAFLKNVVEQGVAPTSAARDPASLMKAA